MALSIYSDADIQNLARLDVGGMKIFMKGKNVRQALVDRRNLQISLANYSKRFPGRDGLDQVQGGIIHLCHMIEVSARKAYFNYYLPRHLAAAAGRLTKAQVKQDLKGHWERFIKKVSF